MISSHPAGLSLSTPTLTVAEDCAKHQFKTLPELPNSGTTQTASEPAGVWKHSVSPWALLPEAEDGRVQAEICRPSDMLIAAWMAVPQYPRKCWDLWLLIALWKAEFADATSLSPVALETYSLMSWYLQVKQPQGHT